MHTITILGDGALGRAVAAAAPRGAADAVRVVGRPAGGRTIPRDVRRMRTSSSRPRADAVAANIARPSTPASAGSSSRRPAGPRSRPGSRRALRQRGGGGRRRAQLQPRRRAVRPAGRGRRGAVRPGRRLRSVPRRVAPTGASATGRRAPPATLPAPDRQPATRGSASSRTTSRWSRSAPARRRGCTSSASTPPARPIELRLDRPRSLAVCRRHPRRRRLADAGRGRPASTRSTPSSTSCSLATPSLPEQEPPMTPTSDRP